MKKLFSLVLLLVATAVIFSAHAQNTGFGGKRVVLKVEALHGTRAAFSGLGAEVVLTRTLTVAGGIRRFSSQYRQRYFEGDFIRDSRTSPCVIAYKGVEVDKADVTSQNQYLELRKYFTHDGAAPAPKGVFAYGNFTWGKADSKGEYKLSQFQNLYSSGNCSPDQTYSYYYKGINTQAYEAGFGYQDFLTPWLTVEVKGGINLSRFNYDGQYTTSITSGVAKAYGPNVVRTNLFSKLASSDPTIRSIGISANVQVGIMLF